MNPQNGHDLYHTATVPNAAAEPTLYAIAKRPKDDSSDDDHYGPSKPVINLSLFKGDLTNCKEVKGKGDIVEQCGALSRLSECMRYFDDVKKEFGDDIAKERLAEFVWKSYENITDDFTHFVKMHQNDFDLIADALLKGGYMDSPCDIRKCANLRRHCTRNQKVKGMQNEKDMHIEYAVNVMDKYHRMVFHLYDMGLRLKVKEMEEAKEGDHGIPDAVDKKLEAEKNLVAQKKKEFAEAAPDIVADDEGTNKFVIGGSVSGKECIMDVIYKAIEKKHDEQAVHEMEEYRKCNAFDSETMEEDASNVNDSNFAADLKKKVLVNTLRDLLGKIQSMFLSFGS